MNSDDSSSGNFLVRSLRYRPEIDGLRAIAIWVVVQFHLGLGLPGGFVGVDVFFVISGFLITSIVISDIESGRFTMAGFWERRARRIVPPLVVMVGATLVAGWLVMLPGDLMALGRSALWQAAFSANVCFWQVTHGYFSAAADEMPLLHTWSLAVEEQFYFCAPFCLVLLLRVRWFRTKQGLTGLLALLVLLGLVGAAVGVSRYQAASFYLLPTRAWELLLGSLVAVAPDWGIKGRRILREALSYAGLGMIAYACLTYGAETPFPGLAALAPCVGAGLVIYANQRSDGDGVPTSLGRVLALGPIVFLGLISYSLYLWHWPVLALYRYYKGEPHLDGLEILLLVLVALACAVLSWWFVERPFRRRRVCGDTRSVFGFAAVSLGTVMVAGLITNAELGFPSRLPDSLRKGIAADPAEDLLYVKDMSVGDVLNERITSFGDQHCMPSNVLVWGDSHAMAALPAFDLAFRKHGVSGVSCTRAACAPIVGFVPGKVWGMNAVALEYNDAVIELVRRKGIKHVVLVSHWARYAMNGSDDALVAALRGTVRRLVSAGATPWVFVQVPHPPVDVYKVLRRSWRNPPDLNDRSICRGADIPWDGICGRDGALAAILEAEGARIIDARPAFLSAEADRYLNEKDGVVLYRDDNHLSKMGAETMLVPILERQLISELRGDQLAEVAGVGR